MHIKYLWIYSINFIKEENAIIYLNENEIKIDDLRREIPIGVRVILTGKNKRKRLLDLGLLSLILRKCEKGEYIVKLFLDLSISMKDIKEKIGVYTELEYLSLCDLERFKELDKDVIYILQQLKNFVQNRNSNEQ
ncbi:hypothetical protein [Sulfolobus acidocaldarius]|uniref:Uncharacterized protein n=4 Tax=Sulfolobus acidocaldarius TaxID=2285 RepID=Q4J8G6_SULAC|nr:hypothetical protein [Sulfolobus acidocaldarius]AAY80915.1 hypothetical protein Saci_1602 [Sulfolobus acidocaldarius DSM 639]AGE71515.1 hypothetical protein SacN8_07775 [Sulfolobus acidocaldarius N8]AGE73788.1 hypothetical protein SacRon12I_07785 [Sulfolobus acidocaldarius Ron12/I]ALU30253.1 hypothetical protein ATY89_10095 [Sulfolobus acidocaldarius]ALU30969.1 hypothetical protein ATZ20_01650 [Sulfolobus acidocaldarius]